MINTKFIKNYSCFIHFLLMMIKNPQLVVDAEKLERYKCKTYTCENIKEDKETVIKCMEGLE